MKQMRRDGTFTEKEKGQDRFLAFLYGSAVGRMLLKPLTAPAVSRLAGRFLSTRLSRMFIRPFCRKNAIDLSQFLGAPYGSYNEFFSRPIRPELRPVDGDPRRLVSPADSKLTVYPVTEDARFTVKHTEYTLPQLLRNDALAAEFAGGQLLLFRLCVDDYHRYGFPADGIPGEPVTIPGVLHTVQPIAGDYVPVYKENAREYALLRTPTFGDVIQMEVGALMVGKIENHPLSGPVRKGQEKGFFRFGGSTVILVVKKDALQVDADILENSRNGWETVVRYGEAVGTAKQ